MEDRTPFSKSYLNLHGAIKSYVGFDETAEDAVQATLSTNLAGNNNDLVFTAKPKYFGFTGNNIEVAYIDPGGTTATLGVVVTGNDTDGWLITVNLGRAAGAINTTGTLLAAAVNAHTIASTLVSVANKAANDGTGLVIALAATALTGGNGFTLFRFGGESDGIIRAAFMARVVEALEGDTDAGFTLVGIGSDGSGGLTTSALFNGVVPAESEAAGQTFTNSMELGLAPQPPDWSHLSVDQAGLAGFQGIGLIADTAEVTAGLLEFHFLIEQLLGSVDIEVMPEGS